MHCGSYACRFEENSLPNQKKAMIHCSEGGCAAQKQRDDKLYDFLNEVRPDGWRGARAFSTSLITLDWVQKGQSLAGFTGAYMT